MTTTGRSILMYAEKVQEPLLSTHRLMQEKMRQHGVVIKCSIILKPCGIINHLCFIRLLGEAQ